MLVLNDFTEQAVSDVVAGTISDSIDEYAAQKLLLQDFRNSLTRTIESLQNDEGPNQLIVFVDEMDRCRPSYSIELLERIKHVFNLPNAIFVIATDKSQLSVSLQAVYGTGLDSDGYLRRFIDLEYALSLPNRELFTRNLWSRFDFDEFFKDRSQGLLNEKANRVDTFSSLADVFDLSLRASEQCFTRIRVAMMATPSNFHLFPVLLVTLVVLRAAKPEAYQNSPLRTVLRWM